MAKKIIMELIDEDNIPESFEEIVDVELSVVEKPITAKDERAVAAQLEGTPHFFDAESVKLLKRLAEKGIAADFGPEGWARGTNWKQYMRSV